MSGQEAIFWKLDFNGNLGFNGNFPTFVITRFFKKISVWSNRAKYNISTGPVWFKVCAGKISHPPHPSAGKGVWAGAVRKYLPQNTDFDYNLQDGNYLVGV